MSKVKIVEHSNGYFSVGIRNKAVVYQSKEEAYAYGHLLDREMGGDGSLCVVKFPAEPLEGVDVFFEEA